MTKLNNSESKKCPQCGRYGTLRIEERFVANPLGTFSLAGAQMKVTAQRCPVLLCEACDLDVLGKYEYTDGLSVSFDVPREDH